MKSLLHLGANFLTVKYKLGFTLVADVLLSYGCRSRFHDLVTS